MMRPQVPLLVLFVAAVYLAPLDASPARLVRQAPENGANDGHKGDAEITHISNKNDTLFHQSGIQVNVPIKPTIYTINIAKLSTFLSDEMSKAIEEKQEEENNIAAQSKSKRSLSAKRSVDARQYKVELVMDISEVEEAEEDQSLY